MSMGERILRRKKEKENIKKKVRILLLFCIFSILLYMAYGFWQEKKIKLVQETKVNTITVEKTVQEENKIVTEKIAESYMDFPVAAKLIIPKIDVETYVLADFTEEGLEKCVSKFWGPEPNEIGNFCIAGHNYLKPNMFKGLKRLEIGNEFYLIDNKNGKIAYTIYDIYQVDENNMVPIDQETNGKRIVTLITCVNYTDHRLIVQARES